MIDKPTHYISESSSYINLIFPSNVNLTKNWGVRQSLYQTCHHNIIYGTLNFDIRLPPPYFREIWDLKKMQILDVFKNRYIILIGPGLFKPKLQQKMQNSETLLNIFHNFI